MFRSDTLFRSCGRLVPVLVAALLSLPALAGAQASGRYELSGNEVAVYNLIGEARVVHGTGSQVTVQVELAGEDAGKLRVETGTIDGKPTLRVIYPGDRFVYRKMGPMSSTQMNVHDNGTFGKGSGRRIKISGSGSGLEAHADLTIEVPDSRQVNVHQAVGEISARDVSADLRLDTAAAPVEARGIHGALSIDVGSGSVRVIDCEGPLAVDTGSGSVEISGIRSRDLSVDTGSGSVEGTDIEADQVAVDTGSGHIELASLAASQVVLETGSGSVSVGLTRDIEKLAIDTGSGGVVVRVPESLGAELVISTGSGGIDVDVPHTSSRVRRSDFLGRIGDGKGSLSIETGSGGVVVQLAQAK